MEQLKLLKEAISHSPISNKNGGSKRKKKKSVVVQHQSSMHSNSYNELSLKLDICAMLKVCDSILSDGKKLQFKRCLLRVKILQF